MKDSDGFRDDGVDLRTALIILSAMAVGMVTGVLTYIAAHQWAVAVIAAGAAVGGASSFFNRVIARQSK